MLVAVDTERDIGVGRTACRAVGLDVAAPRAAVLGGETVESRLAAGGFFTPVAWGARPLDVDLEDNVVLEVADRPDDGHLEDRLRGRPRRRRSSSMSLSSSCRAGFS